MAETNTNVNNPEEHKNNETLQDNQQDDVNSDKQFSQQELDDIITKRLARERKQWEKALDDERKKANMDDLERIKHEKEEAELKVATIASKANERLVLAEAKVQALALGIDTKKLPYVLKLANLNNEELVNEDGDVDEQGIEVAIQTVVADFPELVTPQAESKGGTDFSQGSNTGMSQEQFDSLDYKEKVELYKNNPELYKSFTTK